MTSSSLDITGERYGRLVALRFFERRNARAYWLFQCDCGVEKVTGMAGVRSGLVRSCGCLHRERCRSGLNRTRHGDAKVGQVTRLHSIWRGMLKRCSPKSKDTRYSLRGIVVCAEWQEYAAFKAWAEANGYSDDLSIDRIDNDGNYEPGNCRWADRKQQCRNRRSSRVLSAFGKEQTMAAWAEELGIGSPTINTRLVRGWTVEQALSTPPFGQRAQ